MALAVYTNEQDKSTVVATSEQALGDLCVWNPSTLQVLATLRTNQKSINMLCFSSDGRLLVHFVVFPFCGVV